MSRWLLLLALTLAATWPAGTHAGEAVIPLRVIYIGNDSTPRAGKFEAFLKRHFTQVVRADAKEFQPVQAREADVVLFDWAQSDGDLTKATFPLGRLEEWKTPTVLLNSAGLLVAGRWQVIGGAG